MAAASEVVVAAKEAVGVKVAEAQANCPELRPLQLRTSAPPETGQRAVPRQRFPPDLAEVAAGAVRGRVSWWLGQAPGR